MNQLVYFNIWTESTQTNKRA